MAAATKISHLRPKALPITTTHNPASLHFFSSSSSSTTPDSNTDSSPEPPPPPQSPHSSFLSGIKASLKSQQQRNPQSPQPPRNSFSFGSSNPNQPTSPRNFEHFSEIRKNLSEFRRRAAPPSPSSPNAFGSAPAPPHSPQQPISLLELFERGPSSKGDSPMSFKDIQNSLRGISKNPAVNLNDKGERLNEYASRPNMGMNPRRGPSLSVIGSTMTPSVFGRELREDDNSNSSDESTKAELVKSYKHEELGVKLRSLRPEKKGDQKDWFSLEELNQRLVKLREMDLKESSGLFGIIRESMKKIEEDQNNQKKKTFTIGSLGEARTPLYMLSPPKEDLVEKYFHPDNMSASEKLKIELQKVRDDFKMSESDCGSARVQVAQLTTKIKHLSEVLHPKDKHSKKGLLAMVEKRKKLLKYMRRTDWDSYCFVLSKLGLRDNPGYKH